MVTTDTRNNLIVIVVIVAIAIMIAAFIGLFANSILQVADKGQNTIDRVGKSVAGNVSNATLVNSLNLQQFNTSMNKIVKSNNMIIHSNNESISNLTSAVQNFSVANTLILGGIKNNTDFNKISFLKLVKELDQVNDALKNMTQKLAIVPVVPVPYDVQNKSCNIYSTGFPFCILPHNHPIFDILGNKTIHK